MTPFFVAYNVHNKLLYLVLHLLFIVFVLSCSILRLACVAVCDWNLL